MTKPSARHVIAILVVSALCALPSLMKVGADEPDFPPSAKLGDAAPALSVAEWIQGGPVTLDKQNIYVVEFWATWCPACVSSIPHLTEIQEKYKDKGVVVVGISSEDAATVRSFIKDEMGDKMKYTVAIDKDDAMSKAFMIPYGFRTIPTAFVIGKDGNVAWRGHNPAELDRVLGELIAGKYDIAAEVRRDQRVKDSNADIQAVSTAMAADDVDKARTLLDAMIAKYDDMPDLQVRIAWTLMKSENEKLRDPKLALKAAKAAHDYTKGEDFAALDTYANALSLNGDLPAAIEKISKAIQLAPNDELKTRFQKTLDGFKVAQNLPPAARPN